MATFTPTGDVSVIVRAGLPPFRKGCADQYCRIARGCAGAVSHANGASGVCVFRETPHILKAEIPRPGRSGSRCGEGAHLPAVIEFEFKRPARVNVHDSREWNRHDCQHIRHLDGGGGDRDLWSPVRLDRDHARQGGESQSWSGGVEPLREDVGSRCTNRDCEDQPSGHIGGARSEGYCHIRGGVSHRTIVARRGVRA